MHLWPALNMATVRMHAVSAVSKEGLEGRCIYGWPWNVILMTKTPPYPRCTLLWNRDLLNFCAWIGVSPGRRCC